MVLLLSSLLYPRLILNIWFLLRNRFHVNSSQTVSFHSLLLGCLLACWRETWNGIFHLVCVCARRILYNIIGFWVPSNGFHSSCAFRLFVQWRVSVGARNNKWNVFSDIFVFILVLVCMWYFGFCIRNGCFFISYLHLVNGTEAEIEMDELVRRRRVHYLAY